METLTIEKGDTYVNGDEFDKHLTFLQEKLPEWETGVWIQSHTWNIIKKEKPDPGRILCF